MERKGNIKYLHIYPTKQIINRGESLNVMFAVKNNFRVTDKFELKLFIKPMDTDEWKIATKGLRELEARKVHHIYMNIPYESFSENYWDGEEYEEFMIYCGDKAPTEEKLNPKISEMIIVNQ